MNTYTYNINPLNLIQLLDEVYTSLNKKLYSTYLGEVVDGTAEVNESIVSLNFNNPLSENEETTLNTLVSNYIYNENYSSFKNFKINNSLNDPSKIDYDILGLNKKRTIIKGFLSSVEYYNNYIYSSNTYSDLVVSEYREYTLNDIGIAVSRKLTSNWILNDNTTGLTKTFTKYYTPEEGIQEGIDRRGNMIGFAKTALLDGLKAIYGEPANQNYAFDLLTSVKVEMDYFSQGYTQPLRDAVSASTKPYMTVGIKEAVIEELTF
jgi:hypothetical protein